MTLKAKEPLNSKHRLRKSFDLVYRSGNFSNIFDLPSLKRNIQEFKSIKTLNNKCKILSTTFANLPKRSTSEKVKRNSIDDGELFSDEIFKRRDSVRYSDKDQQVSSVLPIKTNTKEAKIEPTTSSVDNFVPLRYENQNYNISSINADYDF